jgi:hypothetical protein
MPKRHVKTSVYLDAETHKRLKKVSDKTMISMANLIRKGVDNVMKEYSK